MSTTMLFMVVGLVGELLLLALVFFGVAFVRARAQRQRDLKAVRTLRARIKNGKAEREKVIAGFLQQGMGLSGEDLQAATVAMLRAEVGLLQRFAGIYGTREAAHAARFDDDLFAALEPYHALTGTAGEVAEASDTEAAGDGEIEFLRKENKRLSGELTITMETMSRMLNEYSTMFAGSTADNQLPIGALAGGGVAAEPEASDGDDVVDSGVEEDTGDVVVQGGDFDDAPADDASPATEDGGGAGAQAVDESAAEPDADDGTGDMQAGEGASEDVPDESSVGQPSPQATIDDPDDIAAILAEAQSREASARGGDAAVAPAADEQSSVGAAGMFDEGEAEVLAVDATDEAVVDVIDDIDDLFDAAADAGGDTEGKDPQTQSGDGAPRSQAG